MQRTTLVSEISSVLFLDASYLKPTSCVH